MLSVLGHDDTPIRAYVQSDAGPDQSVSHAKDYSQGNSVDLGGVFPNPVASRQLMS
ncbi:hypothetical protein ThimaDRAFT_3474 [Thiocapsa marina 5811]|uniref:Uncharacterized protein n=1 Tax=Thiocapsa marina 5811 TaxID=768671 RepID=F9UEX1_9GAMM|nr:hypothetical protein ThimaDRAFT_3474 [Thiocapsa marina 5811]